MLHVKAIAVGVVLSTKSRAQSSRRSVDGLLCLIEHGSHAKELMRYVGIVGGADGNLCLSSGNLD